MIRSYSFKNISPDEVRTNQEKTKAVALIWAKYKRLYTLNELFKYFKLKRSTYYDELKRINKPDKYAKLKEIILKIFTGSYDTYGYRRIWSRLITKGYHYCPDTIRRLTGILDIKVSVYSKHTAKYHSYKGRVGRIAPNILKQHFTEKRPYHALHTDVTQVRLINGKWGYISSIEDEASKEVLALTISSTPAMPFIYKMINILKNKIPNGIHPILHSDQGWQYQMKPYHHLLKRLGYHQSMSRKGNCHDNAPAESFFNSLKREWLNRYAIHNLTELKYLTYKYVQWFNHKRISMKTKGLTPIEYRNQTLGLA